jgi:hypothetical protein
MSAVDLIVIASNLIVAFAVAGYCIRRDRMTLPSVDLADVLREPLSGFSVQS